MANQSKTVVLNTAGVTFADVINVARFNAKVEISPEAKAAIRSHVNISMSTQLVVRLSMVFQLDLEVSR
jgi:histidine ammonia-lyase